MAAAGQAWSEPVEGEVQYIRPRGEAVELDILSGTNHMLLAVDNPRGLVPTLHSRIRAAGAKVSAWDQTQLLTGFTVLLAQNVGDLRRVAGYGQHAGCLADLNGQVLGISPNGRFLAFADGTGAALLELRPTAAPVTAGQNINLEGNCSIEGGRPVFHAWPVVDNDDSHSMLEKSGGIYLAPGRHALRLDWFNRDLPSGLEVYYQGPDLPRQRIPGTALFRQTNASGLDYACYLGSWLRVPDFQELLPEKTGVASNFDIGVVSRPVDVALEYTGYISVSRGGLYTFSTISDDGSLLFLDEKPPVVQVTGTNALPDPVPVAVQQRLPEGQAGGWSQVDGTVTFAGEQSGHLDLELSSSIGRMRVEVLDVSGLSQPPLLNRQIRATGICVPARTIDGQTVAGELLTPGIRQLEFRDADAGTWSHGLENKPPGETKTAAAKSASLPLLTQVDQIKRLTRDQWERGYPVKIRGIVTTVLDGGIFIEDSTWSIYARWQPPTDNETPRVGDYWEIEGNTFAEFAPNIRVTRATRLGEGTMPEPLHPNWDQLINGSLDTEYIEVQGIMTAVNPDGVTLLTRSGKLALDLINMPPRFLRQYENALVRVRGCVIPVRNIRTQQVELGHMRLSNASLAVDEPAPIDPFAAPLKHAADFLLFDWRAGALRRIKIAGQILHERNGEFYLLDGHDGMRFIPNGPVDLKPGDMAEAVGYLQLGGPSPVLHEAVARRTGTAAWPQPVVLDPSQLLNHKYDSTLVRVQARLVDVSHYRSDDLMEMQAGARGFIARLNRHDGTLPPLTPGSLLELTGTYSGQGGDLLSGQEVRSFELLLNSGDDVKIIDHPSWWTMERALALLGGMAMVLLGGLIWIALLRRQVEERTRQLAAEIRRHEQTERQRELERERARIARDLHDDLGAALTQIRFLSAVESRDTRTPEGTRSRMGQVSEKSREMVASLDEIVWAVNPANDSPGSLASYLCHFAEEFFAATPIRCRLDVGDSLPVAPLTSEVRHHLYLAVREAMNNIAKHAQATEVWLRIHAPPEQLRIEIEDNGRGISSEASGGPGEGLTNMRERLSKIDGRFECEPRAGGGTVCRFILRLQPSSFERAAG